MAKGRGRIDAAGNDLQELSRLYGAMVEYEDAGHDRRHASAESLLRILELLGAPVANVADVPHALAERRAEPWRHGLEPVMVAWDGRLDPVTLRLPAERAERELAASLQREDGETTSCRWSLRDFPAEQSFLLDGVTYVAKQLAWPVPLAWGYHRLTVEIEGTPRGSLVISAPSRAYVPESGEARSWGVFLPLYALRSASSWGAGDFGDLGRLLNWTGHRGGGVVATLPMGAAFLDQPFEPSPYSPVSRLFWNEFYVDVSAVPELATCAAARSLLASSEFAREVDALRAQPLVDYRRQMALTRRVLSELAREFFARPADSRREAFERFRSVHPQADDYAAFRAAGERFGRPWPEWPQPQRDGRLAPADYDEEVRRYHLYVQWLADEQLAALAGRAAEMGPGLYLDLPLGVHGHGYDVWRDRSSFAVDASGGCPPDLVFPGGQDWGFPPLHPERIRADGYGYVRRYVQHQMQRAGILRIDHMPVFHRLWWVPRGMAPSQGVYVRYAAEELYALFSLESHRHRTMLVGEDLGTVPPEVPSSMQRHGVHRMFVLQYALAPEPAAAIPPPPEASVASLNTHDMPHVAAFLAGDDIRARAELGLLGGQDPQVELEKRRELCRALRTYLGLDDAADDPTVLRACLVRLAQSEARIQLVDLEDLWGETHAQNIPSTADRHPNWRRKARYTLEEFDDVPGLRELIEAVAAARKGPPLRPWPAGKSPNSISGSRHTEASGEKPTKDDPSAGVPGTHQAK